MDSLTCGFVYTLGRKRSRRRDWLLVSLFWRYFLHGGIIMAFIFVKSVVGVVLVECFFRFIGLRGSNGGLVLVLGEYVFFFFSFFFVIRRYLLGLNCLFICLFSWSCLFLLCWKLVVVFFFFFTEIVFFFLLLWNCWFLLHWEFVCFLCLFTEIVHFCFTKFFFILASLKISFPSELS